MGSGGFGWFQVGLVVCVGSGGFGWIRGLIRWVRGGFGWVRVGSGGFGWFLLLVSTHKIWMQCSITINLVSFQISPWDQLA